HRRCVSLMQHCCNCARASAMNFSARAQVALRQGGGRITPARRALLDLLERSRRPLGPRELHRELRRRGVSIDRVSVYRNLAALLGGAIALLAREHPAVLERTRTFAFAAAAGVVAFHLLPEVLPTQGLVSLLWMSAGFALPWALEAAARAFGPGLLHGRGLSGMRVAAEVGFAALIFHSVVEGLALVAALARPVGKLDLEIALVAHHAPLTAAV